MRLNVASKTIVHTVLVLVVPEDPVWESECIKGRAIIELLVNKGGGHGSEYYVLIA